MTRAEQHQDAVAPFPYEGPAAWRDAIVHALERVVDPEVALNIVDVGLVYGVVASDERVHLRITMTSAACPVTDVILEEVQAELESVLPPEVAIDLELVWDPPWTTERMSARARRFMGG